MFLRRWLKNLPRWQESLWQSMENPLQADRLKNTSFIELEYPTRQYTPQKNRRHAFWVLSLGGLIGLALFANEFALSIRDVAPFLHAAVASVAVGFFAVAYLGRDAPWWRWFVYLLGLPIITLILFIFHEPYLLLLVAILLATLAADLFAGHCFHLKTTAPMPRARALKLRQYWPRRFRPLRPTVKGLEFYLFAWLTVPLSGVLIILFAPRPLYGTFLKKLPLMLAGLALLVFLPFVIEYSMPLLFGRKRVSTHRMREAFSAAVVLWFTYNRKGIVAPGTYQSPSGTYRQRRRMSLALMTVFAACACQLFSYHRDHTATIEQLAGFPDSQQRELRPHPENSSHLAFRPAPLAELRRPNPPLHEDITPSLFQTVSYQSSGETRDLDDLDLQPYEEAMLESMDPDQRRDFLEQLAQEKKARDEAASGPTPPRTPLQDQGKPARFPFSRVVFLWIWVGIAYCIYPIVCTCLPPLYFLACCFSVSARLAGAFAEQYGTDPSERLFATKTWDKLVKRVNASDDDVEQDSLLLGVNAFDDTPVLVPRTVFDEHAHLLGDSGSGKTALGLSSLISQLVRFREHSVIVLDPKGDDMALFENLRLEAEEAHAAIRKEVDDPKNERVDGPDARYTFRWFTNELNRSTYTFNPLTQAHFSELSLYQRTDVLSAAIGLRYGTDYGRGYFSDANAEVLYKAFVASPRLRSFKELERAIYDIYKQRGHIDHEIKRAATHLGSIINRLATCEPLNVTDNTNPNKGVVYNKSVLDNAIDLGGVFRRPQAFYFNLPSSIGSATAAEIARLVLYSLLSAAKFAGQDRKQVYLIIDEFQRIVAQNLELILQTARSMNIGVILANQTIADLKTSDVDTVSTVRANTRFKQVFAASDLVEQDELVQSSGERIVYNRSWSEYLGIGTSAGGVNSTSFSEEITPRLRPNDVLLASDDPKQSIVQIRRGAGYAQFGGMPFIMTSDFHIPKKLYDKRKKAAWRPQTDETISPVLEHPKSPLLDIPLKSDDDIVDSGSATDTPPPSDRTGEETTAGASPQSHDPAGDHPPETSNQPAADTPAAAPDQDTSDAMQRHWHEQQDKQAADRKEYAERRKRRNPKKTPPKENP